MHLLYPLIVEYLRLFRLRRQSTQPKMGGFQISPIFLVHVTHSVGFSFLFFFVLLASVVIFAGGDAGAKLMSCLIWQVFT